MAELDPSTERALRARIIELERLLDARTQTIVGLGAEVAELRGHRSPVEANREPRTATRARRLYSVLRGKHG